MGFPSPIVTSVSQEILFLSETVIVEAARSKECFCWKQWVFFWIYWNWFHSIISIYFSYLSILFHIISIYLKPVLINSNSKFQPTVFPVDLGEEGDVRQLVMWTSELSEGTLVGTCHNPNSAFLAALPFLKLRCRVATTHCSLLAFNLQGRQLQPQHKYHSGLLVHRLGFGPIWEVLLQGLPLRLALWVEHSFQTLLYHWY